MIIKLDGKITSGRRKHSKDPNRDFEKLKSYFLQAAYPGSLNVILEKPIGFNPNLAVVSGSGNHKYWEANIFGNEKILIHRFNDCPFHIVQIVSTDFIRGKFGLSDGDSISISISSDSIVPMNWIEIVFWSVLWKFRENLFYTDSIYSKWCRNFIISKIFASQNSINRRMSHCHTALIC